MGKLRTDRIQTPVRLRPLRVYFPCFLRSFPVSERRKLRENSENIQEKAGVSR